MIDTAEKRRSVAGVGFYLLGVTPNAAKDQEWRQQSAYSYSGILAVSSAAAGSWEMIPPFMKHRRIATNRV